MRDASRYSTPPDAAKLEESTERLRARLDGLEANATPMPPAGAESEFFDAVRARLRQGQQAYGDKSFSRDPAELVGEIEQELLDICGWSFVTWCRLRKMQRALEFNQ